MRDNRKDLTLERNYIQKFRFLIREYELVKAKKHPQFRFVQDFYKFHGTSRQTFAKYYNRHRCENGDESLLPQKRGPRWKRRRTLPFIEQKVLELRHRGVNRYEIHAILLPTLKSHTPAPSTIYAISRRHNLNRLTKTMQQSKRRIIKTRAGELGHLDCHYLSRDLILGAKRRSYLVSVLDACTRLAWAEVVDDLRASRRRSGSGLTPSVRGWRECWRCRRRTRSCVLRTSRMRQTASVKESVPTSNPESGKRRNETKVRNGQSLPSAHRNGCHCGHHPRSPASVPTTATGPLSPAAVERCREVTLNLTRVPPSSLMRSGATSHFRTSFRTLSMRKPRGSVVSGGAQPHPENLPPVIHVDPPGKVRIGTQARRFQICGSYDACRDRADSRARGQSMARSRMGRPL